MAAAGYCKDLIELKWYIRDNVDKKTEIHMLDYINRYADVLLENLVNVKSNYILTENKIAYSYCKKRISRILSNEYQELEWAISLKIDDVNVMTEAIAKDGLLGDKPRIFLGEGCNSIGYIAGMLDEPELTRISMVMAYAMFYAPFYSALTEDKEFKRNPRRFNANSFSICAKKMVKEGLCGDERSKEEVIAEIPKIMRTPCSIAFFERKIRKLNFYRICETQRLLERMENGYSVNRNINIIRLNETPDCSD